MVAAAKSLCAGFGIEGGLKNQGLFFFFFFNQCSTLGTSVLELGLLICSVNNVSVATTNAEPPACAGQALRTGAVAVLRGQGFLPVPRPHPREPCPSAQTLPGETPSKMKTCSCKKPARARSLWSMLLRPPRFRCGNQKVPSQGPGASGSLAEWTLSRMRAPWLLSVCPPGRVGIFALSCNDTEPLLHAGCRTGCGGYSGGRGTAWSPPPRSRWHASHTHACKLPCLHCLAHPRPAHTPVATHTHARSSPASTLAALLGWGPAGHVLCGPKHRGLLPAPPAGLCAARSTSSHPWASVSRQQGQPARSHLSLAPAWQVRGNRGSQMPRSPRPDPEDAGSNPGPGWLSRPLRPRGGTRS